jgi:hypothetical protein
MLGRGGTQLRILPLVRAQRNGVVEEKRCVFLVLLILLPKDSLERKKGESTISCLSAGGAAAVRSLQVKSDLFLILA